MAGIKITDLPAVPSSLLTDVFPADQGATTYKETLQQVMTLFESNIVITPTNFSGTLPVNKGGTGISTFTPYAVITAGTTATGAFQNVVGLGTAGEQLTSNGPGALPTWQAGTLVTPSALTRVDDSNVTLTLGGTPSTALLQAVSITAGWAGQLSLARGGTAASLTASVGGIVYSTATELAILSGTATAGQIIRSGASAAPTWSTATYPATAGTSGNLLTSDGTNWTSVSAAGVGSPLTTKGDIYTFSTVNARLAVGATNGQVLQVASGAATGLAWSTATFPSTATNAARILRSDGTNWVETTATFADTYAASGFLYANGSNNVAGLATANNGLPVTGNTGVPVMLAGPGSTGLTLLSNAAAAPSWSTGKPITQVVSQIFLANGTYTPTTGMQYCIVEAIGGGGGGGGTATGAGNAGAGGGGGAGGYARSVISAATIGASQAVTIGAAGAAGAAGNNAGGAGGATSLGALVVVGGGSPGSGSPNVAAAAITSTGGAGGTASTGDFLEVGGNGGSGFSIAPTVAAVGGQGADSLLGGGGKYAAAATGVTASGYGAGGSGGVCINGSGTAAGGAGSAGIIRITEFVSV